MNKIGGSKIDYECFSPELEASCNEIQHLFKERILAKIEKRKAQKLGLLPLGALPAIVFFFKYCLFWHSWTPQTCFASGLDCPSFISNQSFLLTLTWLLMLPFRRLQPKMPILPFHNRTLPTALRTQAQICTFCMICKYCIFCIWESCYCCGEPGAVEVRFSTTALTAVTGYSKLSTALRICCMVIILKMGWLSQTDSFNVQSILQTLKFHL